MDNTCHSSLGSCNKSQDSPRQSDRLPAVPCTCKANNLSRAVLLSWAALESACGCAQHVGGATLAAILLIQVVLGQPPAHSRSRSPSRCGSRRTGVPSSSLTIVQFPAHVKGTNSFCHWSAHVSQITEQASVPLLTNTKSGPLRALVVCTGCRSLLRPVGKSGAERKKATPEHTGGRGFILVHLSSHIRRAVSRASPASVPVNPAGPVGTDQA